MSDEDDVLESAGRWYVGVLDATAKALVDCDLPEAAAPFFIAALARRGYSIEPVPETQETQ